MARVLQNRCPLSLSSQSDNPKLWKVSRSRGEAAAQSLETGGGRRGTGTWPRAVKAPRARQDRTSEYWPGSLQEARKQANSLPDCFRPAWPDSVMAQTLHAAGLGIPAWGAAQHRRRGTRRLACVRQARVTAVTGARPPAPAHLRFGLRDGSWRSKNERRRKGRPRHLGRAMPPNREQRSRHRPPFRRGNDGHHHAPPPCSPSPQPPDSSAAGRAGRRIPSSSA